MIRKTLFALALCLTAFAAQARGGFSLWQLASQADKIGNSYVLVTDKGRVVVIDGGYAEEAPTYAVSSRLWAGKWTCGSLPILTPITSAH